MSNTTLAAFILNIVVLSNTCITSLICLLVLIILIFGRFFTKDVHLLLCTNTYIAILGYSLVSGSLYIDTLRGDLQLNEEMKNSQCEVHAMPNSRFSGSCSIANNIWCILFTSILSSVSNSLSMVLLFYGQIHGGKIHPLTYRIEWVTPSLALTILSVVLIKYDPSLLQMLRPKHRHQYKSTHIEYTQRRSLV